MNIIQILQVLNYDTVIQVIMQALEHCTGLLQAFEHYTGIQQALDFYIGIRYALGHYMVIPLRQRCPILWVGNGRCGCRFIENQAQLIIWVELGVALARLQRKPTPKPVLWEKDWTPLPQGLD